MDLLSTPHFFPPGHRRVSSRAQSRPYQRSFHPFTGRVRSIWSCLPINLDPEICWNSRVRAFTLREIAKKWVSPVILASFWIIIPKHIVQLTVILYLNPNNFVEWIAEGSLDLLIRLRRDFPRWRNGQRLTRWSPKKSISAFEMEYRLPLDVFRFTCHGQQAAMNWQRTKATLIAFWFWVSPWREMWSPCVSWFAPLYTNM